MPPCDILFLTHRTDLIEQLRRHVAEFNTSHSDTPIVLHELKDYAAVKRERSSLFREQGITVFYYRSDNLSAQQKEKILDFRNYDNDGKWFVLLDEAHKGDREDSKRQHIYSILSRNGFLFNFSATFTDPRDIATTVCNFNLAEYIRRGYGKHLLVVQPELSAFRDKPEDDPDAEKRKVVLKMLIMLAYVRKVYERTVQPAGLYHRPLLLLLGTRSTPGMPTWNGFSVSWSSWPGKAYHLTCGRQPRKSCAGNWSNNLSFSLKMKRITRLYGTAFCRKTSVSACSTPAATGRLRFCYAPPIVRRWRSN
ncbi:DEAD/DEAH box helicase family protein [Chloracidobacterium aggregatum]|uniref:DEAD/DEAH box helicase family protein n=1 Tax=Chloracidobacterium aggregatum TaxID=2851959 RepID=UPI001B8B6F06|nr:DEAD/DEAH box helicase family protein [Chloracidobacterium aggregatum]QUV98465.1 DEAD/DEAH box helicase family protein [Chloracidobacterium sp. E]